MSHYESHHSAARRSTYSASTLPSPPSHVELLCSPFVLPSSSDAGPSYVQTSRTSLPPRRRSRRNIPLPCVAASRFRLHSSLQASQSPRIQWDTLTPPFCAVHSPFEVQEQNPSWLLEPATNPPCQSMTIRAVGCDNVIAVFAGPSNMSYITILDVLTHVHDAPDFALQAPYPRRARPVRSTSSTEGEAPGAPLNGGLLLGIDLAPIPERRGGYRRDSDMVAVRANVFDGLEVEGEGRRWIGLRQSTTEQEVWSLVLR